MCRCVNVCEDRVYICLLLCSYPHAVLMFLTHPNVLRSDGQKFEHGDQTINSYISYSMLLPKLTGIDY